MKCYPLFKKDRGLTGVDPGPALADTLAVATLASVSLLPVVLYARDRRAARATHILWAWSASFNVFEYDPPVQHEARKVALSLGASLLGLLVAATRLEASAPCARMPVTQSAVATSDQFPAVDHWTIASLNIAGDPRTGDTVAAWARERGVDVLLLQEVGNRSHDGGTFVAALSDRLGFHFAYAPADRLGDAETQGLAILSRHRLGDLRTYPLKYHHLRFRSRCRIALTANLTTANGPIRLVNVHLDTRINSRDRIAQLAPLLDALVDTVRFTDHRGVWARVKQ